MNKIYDKISNVLPIHTPRDTRLGYRLSQSVQAFQENEPDPSSKCSDTCPGLLIQCDLSLIAHLCKIYKMFLKTLKIFRLEKSRKKPIQLQKMFSMMSRSSPNRMTEKRRNSSISKESRL